MMKTVNYAVKCIELADALNSSMPDFVVTRSQDILNGKDMCIKGRRILIIGVSYKRDVSDCRETPALRVVELLKQKGARVEYHDPLVPFFQANGTPMKSQDLVQALARTDLAVIVTVHGQVDYETVCRTAPLVFDARGITRRLGIRLPNVYTL